MAEAGIDHRQHERIDSGKVERSKRPSTDGVVSVIGVRTGIGILVAVNGCAIGFAEHDGSEEEEVYAEPKTEIEKPLDDISRLKNLILAQTNGDTQKIALYLAEIAEQDGKKVKIMHLAEKFGLTKIIVHRILVTLDGRAINNNWPLLISYSQSSGVNFVTRKHSFGPR